MTQSPYRTDRVQENNNISSAYFPPLTIDDLNSSNKFTQEKQQNQNQAQYQSASIESDFDMSVSISVTSSSLIKSVPKRIQRVFLIYFYIFQQDMKNRMIDFSRSVQNYNKKFESGQESTNINQDSNQMDISMRMENFRQKIQEIQNELQSHHTKSPTSDPYKISLRSLHQEKDSKENYGGPQFTQSRQHTSSVSSGGLSFQAPHLYSTSVKKMPFELKQTQLSDLELHRIKYYDSYLPEAQRMLNCPYKLLKHKIQTRDRNRLTQCLEEFNLMDMQLTMSLK